MPCKPPVSTKKEDPGLHCHLLEQALLADKAFNHNRSRKGNEQFPMQLGAVMRVVKLFC